MSNSEPTISPSRNCPHRTCRGKGVVTWVTSPSDGSVWFCGRCRLFNDAGFILLNEAPPQYQRWLAADLEVGENYLDPQAYFAGPKQEEQTTACQSLVGSVSTPSQAIAAVESLVAQDMSFDEAYDIASVAYHLHLLAPGRNRPKSTEKLTAPVSNETSWWTWWKTNWLYLTINPVLTILFLIHFSRHPDAERHLWFAGGLHALFVFIILHQIHALITGEVSTIAGGDSDRNSEPFTFWFIWFLQTAIFGGIAVFMLVLLWTFKIME